MNRTSMVCLMLVLATRPAFAAEPERYVLGQAYKIPSEYTNQESGYFAIVEGHNGRVYIGAAKYGVNSYLIEFDPKTEKMQMVVDVHQVIGSKATGFAAQAKIHTRNNVGASGKIYVGTKQGYPEKNEKRSDYPGGYAMTYDPASGKAEHFGIAKPQHGIISITPDESRGVAYISTCSDERPIDHCHFMVLDLKKKSYRDLGDLEHQYAFIVLDDKGRAYHPIRGGKIARYTPPAADSGKQATDGTLEKLDVTIDGKPPSAEFTRDDTILNWDATPDGKTLYAVEIYTNQLFVFDLTAMGNTIPGKRLGELIPGCKKTDCRAMCVSPKGIAWMAVTRNDQPAGPVPYLISYSPAGKSGPRIHGVTGIANPNYTTLVDDKGKPKPWHHALRKEKDGTLVPWVPLGIAAGKDGSVYVLTLAPFTVLKYSAEKLK